MFSKILVATDLSHIEINRQADEHDCSLIAVGSHGQTMAGQIMLGGMASAVIHSATRPVLILRLRVKDESGRDILGRGERNRVCGECGVVRGGKCPPLDCRPQTATAHRRIVAAPISASEWLRNKRRAHELTKS